MITVVSGIRDLYADSCSIVERAIADEVARADEIRFGGALGSDSVALSAALQARPVGGVRPVLRVFVPAQLADLPELARKIALRCADEVVELGYPPGEKWTYLRRNDRMLDGADRLLTFTDGRSEGVTAYTIKGARRRRFDVQIVRVQGTKVLAL